MKREGYDADYAVNVTTHASLVGALMPTSHNIIIYTLAAGGLASITSLILAGIIPAIILMVCNLGAAYYVARKRGYPSGIFPGWRTVARTFAAAAPGLFVIVIIVSGILSGVFTATESASIAVLYALCLTRPRLSQPVISAIRRGSGPRCQENRRRADIDRRFRFIAYYQIAEMTGDLLATISDHP